MEHLTAQFPDILPNRVVCGTAYRSQHQRHQRHAHRHELPPQLSNHDKCTPLSKILWKMLKTAEKAEKAISCGGQRSAGSGSRDSR